MRKIRLASLVRIAAENSDRSELDRFDEYFIY